MEVSWRLLLLLKILRIPAKFGFYISWKGIKVCAVSYGVILVLTLFNNLRRVHFSRPVELLSGGNAGEREPKKQAFMAIAGFGCLGTGYYLAVTTESIIDALGVIFYSSPSCYGRNISGIYFRQYCDFEAAAQEKKVLL